MVQPAFEVSKTNEIIGGQKQNEATRATLDPDPVLLEQLQAMNEGQLRGRINQYATEARFWTEKDKRIQFTMLYYLQVTASDKFASDRENPKSKIAKALRNLSAKFPNLAGSHS